MTGRFVVALGDALPLDPHAPRPRAATTAKAATRGVARRVPSRWRGESMRAVWLADPLP